MRGIEWSRVISGVDWNRVGTGLVLGCYWVGIGLIVNWDRGDTGERLDQVYTDPGLEQVCIRWI